MSVRPTENRIEAGARPGQARLGRRILFASAHSTVDFSSGAFVATSELAAAKAQAGKSWLGAFKSCQQTIRGPGVSATASKRRPPCAGGFPLRTILRISLIRRRIRTIRVRQPGESAHTAQIRCIILIGGMWATIWPSMMQPDIPRSGLRDDKQSADNEQVSAYEPRPEVNRLARGIHIAAWRPQRGCPQCRSCVP